MIRKKLIEVDLPLDPINYESGREKSIHYAHPSVLHIWWARRPLATCRAILWASLVDDPSSWPDRFPTKEEQDRERQRLFDILGRLESGTKDVVRGLVSWKEVNDLDSGVLEQAQREIARCLAWARNEEPPTDIKEVRDYIAKYAPPVYDPFAGGGSIPFEAQRLGLRVYASDLNPVAVLINKALLEIPVRFKDMPPVSLKQKIDNLNGWQGTKGLVTDIRYYGKWMRDKAWQRIGHLYPKVKIDNEGTEATVIAWVWARTITCPNPLCKCKMPLVRSFHLSSRKGKETWIEPVFDNLPEIRYTIKSGNDITKIPNGTVGRKGARCIACGTNVSLDYVRQEFRSNRMEAKLMAIVAEGLSGRLYLPADAEHERIAVSVQPAWKPETDLPEAAIGIRLSSYGTNKHADLFTSRQLETLTTFSDLVKEAQVKATQDAIAAGLPDDNVPLKDGGTGARAYGEVIATYLGMGVSKLANRSSNLCFWKQNTEAIQHVFRVHALSRNWDFCEGNPFSNSSGSFLGQLNYLVSVLENCAFSDYIKVIKHNAIVHHPDDAIPKLVSTDPPYYDNIGYADLSDFFYIWLQRSIGSIYPNLFDSPLTPKEEELVADSHRFGGNKQQAKTFFQEGFRKFFERMYSVCHEDYPFTVYYAFKKQDKEVSDDVRVSTGWEAMLDGLIRSGFIINNAWPVQTESKSRLNAKNGNALISSVVLVCRRRPTDAPIVTKEQFINELKEKIFSGLDYLLNRHIYPVDISQAVTGLGMSVYSQYDSVLDVDSTLLTTRSALQLINQYLDEYLSEFESKSDSKTRLAVYWFTQYQFEFCHYDTAETFSKNFNLSINSLIEDGIAELEDNKVRLVTRDKIARLNKDHVMSCHWTVIQSLIYALEAQREEEAANLLPQAHDQKVIIRNLAYYLHNVCDKKDWSQEAKSYNNLIASWNSLVRLRNMC